MKNSKLFSKTIAKDFDDIFDLLDNMWEIFNESNYIFNTSKKTYDYREIGLYIKSRQEIKDIFIGVWLEAWELSGMPICIVCNWNKASKDEEYTVAIKDYCEAHAQDGLKFYNVRDYPCVTLNETFFDKPEVPQRIKAHIDALGKRIQFVF